jgi:hypothetical protein
MGTVISFRDDNERPHAEIVLDDGDRVALTLDSSGLTIAHLADDGRTTTLFAADPATVSRLCAALVTPTGAAAPRPLPILVAAVVQIASADLVARAFRDAAKIA